MYMAYTYNHKTGKYGARISNTETYTPGFHFCNGEFIYDVERLTNFNGGWDFIPAK